MRWNESEYGNVKDIRVKDTSNHHHHHHHTQGNLHHHHHHCHHHHHDGGWQVPPGQLWKPDILMYNRCKYKYDVQQVQRGESKHLKGRSVPPVGHQGISSFSCS